VFICKFTSNSKCFAGSRGTSQLALIMSFSIVHPCSKRPQPTNLLLSIEIVKMGAVNFLWILFLALIRSNLL
jgi:hypothetical protein